MDADDELELCPGRAPIGGRRYCYEGCPDWPRVQDRLGCPAHLMAHQPAAGGDPWRNLAASVLLLALSDIRQGGLSAQDAIDFLRSEDGQWYAQHLSIGHAALMAAARQMRYERR